MKRSTLTTASAGLPRPVDSYPILLDTSLDLSINSFRHLENHNPKGQTVGDTCCDGDTRSPAAKQEGIVTVEELNRMKSEHKKMSETLLAMYKDLWSQMMDMRSSGNRLTTNRKRKFEDYEWDNAIKICESSSSGDEEVYRRMHENGRTKVFRVYVQVDPSDMSLIVKDGYHWKKYGQKVTRDNPSPRAYFKCSIAPSCPVKKKVQRSVDNPCLLVATYEGQHNHHRPTTQTKILSPNSSSNSQGYHYPEQDNVVLDLIRPPGQHNPAPKQPVDQEPNNSNDAPLSADNFPQLLAQQMASNLTRDPNFTAALVTAISGRILDQEIPENWRPGEYIVRKIALTSPLLLKN